MTRTREAFPDLVVEVSDVVLGDGFPVAQWTVRGTNEGPLFGSDATNRTAEWDGATIYRLEGETVAEAWWYYDMLGIFEQLGVTPEELPA